MIARTTRKGPSKALGSITPSERHSAMSNSVTPAQFSAVATSLDPSERTVDQLRQEILSLRELIEARLNASDKAVTVLNEVVAKMPTPAIVDEHVTALKELTEQKIMGLREVMDTTFKGTAVALDAALKTQKEASDKIETNFTKQFEGVGNLMANSLRAIDDKVQANKERLDRSEGKEKGNAAIIAILVSVGSVIIAAVGVAVAILSRGS